MLSKFDLLLPASRLLQEDKAHKAPMNHLRDGQRLSDVDDIYIRQVIGVSDSPGRGAKAYSDRGKGITLLHNIGLPTS